MNLELSATFAVTNAAEIDIVAKGLNAIAASLKGGKSGGTTEAVTGEQQDATEGKGKKADKPAADKKPAGGKKAKAADDESTKTIKDVRATFSKLIDTLGEEDGPAAGKKLLKKYGAKQIPDLDATNYAAIIEDAESMIAEAANVEGEDDDLGLGDDGDDE